MDGLACLQINLCLGSQIVCKSFWNCQDIAAISCCHKKFDSACLLSHFFPQGYVLRQSSCYLFHTMSKFSLLAYYTLALCPPYCLDMQQWWCYQTIFTLTFCLSLTKHWSWPFLSCLCSPITSNTSSPSCVRCISKVMLGDGRVTGRWAHSMLLIYHSRSCLQSEGNVMRVWKSPFPSFRLLVLKFTSTVMQLAKFNSKKAGNH